MVGHRVERIARVIREEASRVILCELSDPRIGFVTVTKVKLSKDFSYARVFVSVMGGDEAREDTLRALKAAAPVVRRSVAPRLKTRTIPQIVFEYDPSVEGSIRVSRLIREARATDPHPTEAPSGGPEDAGGDLSRAPGSTGEEAK